MSRADEHTLAQEVADLSRTISTDSEGAWWGDSPDDHMGNIAGYIGSIESLLDDTQVKLATLRAREKELVSRIETVANSVDFVLEAMPAKMRPGLQAIVDELRAALSKVRGA